MATGALDADATTIMANCAQARQAGTPCRLLGEDADEVVGVTVEPHKVGQ